MVTSDIDDASKFISDSIEGDGFVIAEEFLQGEEASLLVLMDESAMSACLRAKTTRESRDGIGALTLEEWRVRPRSHSHYISTEEGRTRLLSQCTTT